MPVWHRAGDGTHAVLLLHGACADHRSMRGLSDAFAETDDLFAPDLRGQGEHQLDEGVAVSFTDIVDDLCALLDAWPMPRLTIVGHSFGSHLAQELAVRRPETSLLVLIGCYDQHSAPSRGERARVAVTSSVVRLLPWPWFARFSARVATRDPELRETLSRSHLVAGREVFLALGESAASAKRVVERYDTTVVLIRGAREYSRRLDAVHRSIASRSERSATAVIAGTGHLCHEEDPREVIRVLRRHL